MNDKAEYWDDGDETDGTNGNVEEVEGEGEGEGEGEVDGDQVKEDEKVPLEKKQSRSRFYRTLDELFPVITDILSSHNKIETSDKKKDVVKEHSDRYYKAYTIDVREGDLDRYHTAFKKLLDDNWKNFNSDVEDDLWIRSKSSSLDLVYDDPNIKKCTLMLTNIYNRACYVKTTNEKLIKKNGKASGMNINLESSMARENFPEIFYPYEFLMIIVKLFKEVCSTNEQYDNLDSKQKFLETKLGKDKPASNNPLEGIDLSKLLDSKLGKSARQIVKKMGMEIPDNFQLPDKDTVNKTLANIGNNSEFGNIVENVFSKMENGGGLMGVVSGLVDELDPETKEMFNSSNTNIMDEMGKLEGPCGSEHF